MGVIVQTPQGEVLYEKGASELVLESCEFLFKGTDNSVVPITAELRRKIEVEIKGMASKGLRTICMAYRENVGALDKSSKDNLGIFEIEKSGLTMLCLLGVRDIPRPEVIEAIKSCKQAGVKVRMVTGDNKITAKAIAE